MGFEIERKFLVVGSGWKNAGDGVSIRQGYLCLDPERTVRVRLAADRGWLTIKGISSGPTRREFEYAIPADEARQLLDELCHRPQIEKRRYRIDIGGLTWEVDEFLGVHAGLVLAEIELDDPQQTFERPAWVGEEVTDDERYSNAWLSQHPLGIPGGREPSDDVTGEPRR